MQISQKKKVILAELALLMAGAIWGSGFVVMKNSLDALPVNYLLAFRFTIAAVGLSLFLFRRFGQMNKTTLIRGFICGAVMFAAYSVQTYGLAHTTSGKNAFLTAVYVVIVPFLYWLFFRKKPTRSNVIAAVVCLLGIGLVALDADFSVNIGDILTLICGVLYAVHIVCVSIFTEKGEDVMTLTLVQFISSALCAWVVAGLFEPFPGHVFGQTDSMFSLFYLGLVCTLTALTLQNLGIKYAPPSHAALLMGTEAPFGCLFGILLLSEPFTLRFGVGFLLIMGAIVLSELGGQKKLKMKE